MRNGTKIIMLIFILVGCSTPKKEVLVSEQIKGDWISDYFEDYGWNQIITFSFQDSTCSYIFPYLDFTKYKIRKDTLIIKERVLKKGGNVFGGKENHKFIINNLDKEKLTLKPLTPKTKELFKDYGKGNLNLIELKKVKKKHNSEFERIGFSSSICYGTCPSMYLEIDSMGHIYFNGRLYSEIEGYYSGTIPKNEVESISTKVKAIELDSLKESYIAGWTDDQTCRIKIKLKDSDKIYKSKIYGFDREPVELRILLHKLMEVYKSANMEKDTTIEEKFQFK